jgi:hypothetical protein
MSVRTIVLAIAIGMAPGAVASAQTTSSVLPSTLSGRWTFVPASGTALIDFWTVRFDGNGAPGSVTGTLTWRGVNCGAKDEPLKGMWDGVELRFQSVLRANANTRNANSNCGDGRGEWVLKRQPGSTAFEGEGAMNEGKINVTVTASP